MTTVATFILLLHTQSVIFNATFICYCMLVPDKGCNIHVSLHWIWQYYSCVIGLSSGIQCFVWPWKGARQICYRLHPTGTDEARKMIATPWLPHNLLFQASPMKHYLYSALWNLVTCSARGQWSNGRGQIMHEPNALTSPVMHCKLVFSALTDLRQP